MVLYDEYVFKDFDEFSILDSITDESCENLFLIEDHEFFTMNEIKIKDMCRVKNDLDLNFLNLHRYVHFTFLPVFFLPEAKFDKKC